MKLAAANIFGIWLVFLIGWIGGMFYAGEVILLPPSSMGIVEWSIFFAGMYILPVVAAVLFFGSPRFNSKSQGPDAQD